jgi:predicted phosphodiesterase
MSFPPSHSFGATDPPWHSFGATAPPSHSFGATDPPSHSFDATGPHSQSLSAAPPASQSPGVIKVPEEPILILSDLHMGHRASRIKDPEQLAPLLSGIRCVVLNGDTAEMRHEEDRPIGRKLAADLAKMCHHLGTKPFFINGNHDPTISHINHFDLASDIILVTHGDVLFFGVTPWSRDAAHYRRKHQEILDGLDPENLSDFEERLRATKQTALELQMVEPPLTKSRIPGLRLALRQLWPPWRPFKILKAWQETPKRAVDLANIFRPKARFVIIGHTHFPGAWKKSGRVVINTGSFIRYFPAHGAIINRDRIEVRQIDLQQGKFRFGKEIGSFALG